MACIKETILFRMNVMEEIFETRSCIEILVNDIKVDTTDQYNVLQLSRVYGLKAPATVGGVSRLYR